MMTRALLLAATVMLGAAGASAQSVNSSAGLVGAGEQSVTLEMGMDYSVLTADVAYRRGIELGLDSPVMVHAAFATPVFVGPRDMRLRLGASHAVALGDHVAVVPELEPLIVRTLDNDVQAMQGVGSRVAVFGGYVSPRLSVGLEVSYDRTWTTHITHTDLYRDVVHEDVVDGWYRATAANTRGGLALTWRRRQLELGLNAGVARTGQLNPLLLVPSYYGTIQGAWRF